MQIVFFFYEGMTALDAIGPYEILSRLPNATTISAAIQSGPIPTDSGISLVAHACLQEVDSADLLVIPGGGSAPSFYNDPFVMNWICKLYEKSTWTASVCTGSLILAAAGLLKAKPATTHWSAMDRLRDLGAVPQHQRIVTSGKIMTAAGVSAGIDMALKLTAQIAGIPFAQAMQLAIEYDPEPPFDVGSVNKAPAALVEAVRTRLVSRFMLL